MIPRKLYEPVCTFARQYEIFFTPAEYKLIAAHTQHRVLPPHTVIMEQGKVVNTLYFLNSGIARLYRVEKGVDHTLGIVSTNYFLSTPLYLQSGQLSTCALESLTTVDVLLWDKASALSLKKAIPKKMYDMELAIMDRLLNWLQDNQIDAICMTAEERYKKLMETQPEVIQQVPLKYVASLLAIHQDSLSRIRKTLGQK
ncbi:cAMP-binding domain of CRP or a regulatory subunit of cAMP-dependent protein kinases [Parapedobacter composti]|uniref:cAMP-binding domain of CRP or a regulatory subunit of cAMP-dependent protein kinases n=1 Tax=Parapedobacter composti TaxID=623281 RepID=A0A1I1K9V8_9SPHI|nr:cyclic nucleotide-binding domain-containing protein [Parapedobacter composti]SFC57697.1 cAMP-binding domain of CRP or a regulatory subunit of cAMP-dependent protein kinases [Parapedobacter composti]